MVEQHARGALTWRSAHVIVDCSAIDFISRLPRLMTMFPRYQMLLLLLREI
jgi:hypothetical protein